MQKEEPVDELISAAQVAEIWNARARRDFGIEAHYTRDSVKVRRTKGKKNFQPAQVTPLGNLYRTSAAWTCVLHPRGRKIEP